MGKILEDFLRENCKNDETISKTLKKELIAVEEEIERRLENLKKANKMLEENAINTKSISKATGLSRKTFYNNGLLAKLVNKYTTTDTETRNKIANLKNKIVEQSEKIDGLVIRDVDRMEYEYQIDKLHDEILTLQKMNNAYKEQHEMDVKKIKELTKPKPIDKSYMA